MTKRSLFIRFLAVLAKMLPGDYLKTFIYLNVISRPRLAVRRALHSFYRMDQIYAVLGHARRHYAGHFSILEFGTADGYTFTKMLYATRYLKMEHRVRCHAFDTFEGMPAAADDKDEDLITGDGWRQGQYKGRYE